MKLSNIFATLAAGAIATVAAAPAERAAFPSVPANKFKSFTLKGWGPQESDASGDLVILDGALESASYIKDLKSKAKFVVCYMSAGTVENWRPDASKFSAVTAKKYRGFGGTETWLDITQWQKLKSPMGARIKQYASAGCQAVEFDNVDCPSNKCVPGVSYEDLLKHQADYLNWLCSAAHDNGMACGMKNAMNIIDRVEKNVQFSISEECGDFESSPGVKECSLYKKAFVDKGKLALGVEYHNHGGKVCEKVAKPFGMLVKYKNSNGKWANCF